MESIRIFVPVDKMKQKYFQITTKQVRRSPVHFQQQLKLIDRLAAKHHCLYHPHVVLKQKYCSKKPSPKRSPKNTEKIIRPNRKQVAARPS